MINFYTQNFTVTPDISAYLENHFQKITRVLPVEAINIRISLNARHSKGQIVNLEAEVKSPAKTFIARVANMPDALVAADEVIEKLRQQIIKYKDKSA